MTEPSAGHGRRRLEAVVHGRVQGVGFRFHVARAAARHGIVGWVANESQGTVRAVGEGDEPALRAWLEALREGPSGAWVDDVEEHWAAAGDAFRAFEIRSGSHPGD
jgi:acylphosphatase